MPHYHFPYLQQADVSKVIDPKVKERMLELHTKLQELGCSIIMLHDEWHIEAPEEKKEQALELMQTYLKTYVEEVLRQAVSQPLGALTAEPKVLQEPWPEVMCACGKELHYNDDSIRKMVEEMIKKQGRCVKMVFGSRAWMVPRHYIALHGIKAAELPELAKALKFEEVPT